MFKKCQISLCVIILLVTTISLSHALPQQDIKIPLKPFWQGDWGNVLGCKDDDKACWETRRDSRGRYKTISLYGCALTSMAMLYWAYGFHWMPDETTHEPIQVYNQLFNPAKFNNYLSDKKHYGFASNYDFDWLKTTTNFYYKSIYSIGYEYIVPKYDCKPFEGVIKTKNGRNASCFRVDWSDPKAMIWLDKDISWSEYTPPIMKITYTEPNSKISHPSHFVVIGGYDEKNSEYRAYNPSKRDNYDGVPKALNTQYPASMGYDYEKLTLYRFQGQPSGGLLDTSMVDFAVHSPVEIQVIDPDGNRIGYDPETKTKLLENPMSLYYEDTPVTAIDGTDTPSEPVKRLTIIEPTQGNYIFKMFGTGDGPYTIDMEWTKSDGSVGLSTSLTGTASAILRETYRVTYSPTGEATLSQTNQSPIANAGANQTSEQSYEIQLDGSGSSDPDGDPLKYSWSVASRPSGSTASISDANAINPTFTPDLAGTYVLQLVVNDHFTDSSPSTVTITATPVQSRISVTPNYSKPLTAGAGFISFDVNNIGRIGVSNGTLNITLTDPDGTTVYTGTQNFGITVGQTKTLDVPVTIPSLKFGNYTLTYTQSDETKTGSPTTVTLANSALASFSFDKSSYRVRDTANLTLTLMNTGKFNLDAVSVTVSAPDAGYTDIQTISIGQGQAQPLQYMIQIPDTILAGQHDVSATLSLASGSSTIQSAKFGIQESSLVVGYSGATTLSAGDTINLMIENVGGLDTSYTSEKFTITDSIGVEIYRGNIADAIMAGEKKTFNIIQIPSQVVSGLIRINVQIKDNKTGSLSYFDKSIEIIGLATVSLQTKTDNDVYLETEPITAVSSILNGSIGFDGGSLRVAVNMAHVSTGQFRRFLPKAGWWPLNSPFGVAVVSDGSVYVADTGNHRIQKFDSNGAFITEWGSYGSSNGQFSGPSGIAIGYDGSVYVVDTWNYRIQKFDSNGNFITKWGSYGSGNGQFNYPYGIAAASDGYIYVADASNNRVQKFDASGNFITKWGSYGSGNGRFNYPQDIDVGSDGSVYVADSFNHRIQKFDGSGNFISTLIGNFYYPRGIAVSSDGSIYVADTGNNSIQKIDSNGNLITKWGSSGSSDGEFRNPRDIAVASDGSLYVLDTDNHRVQKFNKNGAFIAKWGSWGGGDGQFNYPYGIAVASDGSVYVADTWNHRIQKFDSSGNFITKWGSYGSGNGQFNGPFGIAVGPDGSLYVADTYNKCIQKFDSNGNFIAKWVVVSWNYDYPWRIAVSPDNAVYVIDGGWNYYNWDYRIRKFDNSGNLISTIRWNIWEYLTAIAVAPDNTLYVSDAWGQLIRQLDSSGNLIAKWGSMGSGDGQFNYPYGIAVASDGSVYVADTGNGRIQKMAFSTTGLETIFEATIPITQLANTGQDYTTNIGTLSATGKFYLEASVKNSLGQSIATAEYPFYIVDGNTVLLLNTDKKIYKPGETVTVTGKVENRTTVAANLTLVVSGQRPEASASTIYTVTFNLSAGGSYPFTFTTTAGGEGKVTLTGIVSQNGSAIAEISDEYEVANPSLSVTVTGPDVVSSAPFDMNVEIKNTGKIDATLQSAVRSQKSGVETIIDTQTITLPAGETRLLQYTQQIAADTTYTATVLGDVNQTATKTVTYGEAAQIEFAPSPQPSPAGGEGVYPEGKIEIPVTITNTGQIEEMLEIAFTLQPSAVSQTKNYYLPKGGSITDTLYYDLTAGSYQLSAVSSQPVASAQVSLKVAKENVATMANTVGSQGADGLIPVTTNLTNTGYNEINGSIQLSVINNLGKNVWQGETLVSGLKPQTSQNYQININSAGIVSGVYNTNIAFYSTSGQQLAQNEAQVRISGPIFEITAMPDYPTFTVGKQGSFTFVIKNTGTVAGTTSFSVRAMDVLSESITDSFIPGEEKSYTFNFTVPEDAEEKDYLADYILTPVSSQGVSGQVEFHIAGVNIGGTPSLDKEAYRNGDTAALTLNISKLSQFEDGDYLAIIRYGAYHDMQSFTLSSQPVTLAFNVPLAEITGENLFYSIHFTSGRTIYRSAVSINKTQPDLFVENLSASQSSLTTYKLSAVIVNQGETASEAAVVSFYDGDPSTGASLIATIPIAGLNKDESVTVTYEWNVLGKAGNHTIYAVVDPNNTVTEWIETNNTVFTDTTIPNVALSVSSSEPNYKANQDVGMLFNMANLTFDITYQGLKLNTTITSPQGEVVSDTANDAPILSPASQASYAFNWNTQSNIPGIYTVKAGLTDGVDTLTEGSAEFIIISTPSVSGNFSLSKDTVIQGFDLSINYALTNNGNVDLSGGEVKAEFIPTNSQQAAATYTQTFGPTAVLAAISQTVAIDKITVEPGDYTLRLTAVAENINFVIGEKPLKVLPPLEVTKNISMQPRVLVLSDKADDAQQNPGEAVIKNVLDELGVYYKITRDITEFKGEMRSGIYNAYLLTGKNPVIDGLDKELRERINAGEAVILVNYEMMEDTKFREFTGVKNIGSLPANERSVTLYESPISRTGTMTVNGKIQKLEIVSNIAVTAGTVYEQNMAYPVVVLNTYGKGRVITFAIDAGESAKYTGSTTYSLLLNNAVNYSAQGEAIMLPSYPAAVEIGLTSLGSDFDLKVKEKLSTNGILLTYPGAVTDKDSIAWEFKLNAGSGKKLLYLTKTDSLGGTYTNTTTVEYLKNNAYEPYNTYPIEIMAQSLTDLEMGILSRLEGINSAGDITEKYRNIINAPLATRQDIQKAIQDLIDITDSLNALGGDVNAIRPDMDSLLKIFGRKWAEAGGE